MQLEESLQYETQRKGRRLGEIYTFGLEMYTFGINDKPQEMPFLGSSISGPRPLRRPSINPIMDGGVEINLEKGPKTNTVILSEIVGPLMNTYVHHDRGPGRLEIKTIISILCKTNKVW